jgi:hypothetical protein
MDAPMQQTALSSVYMLVFVGYQLLELTYPTIQGTTQCAARSVRHAVPILSLSTVISFTHH